MGAYDTPVNKKTARYSKGVYQMSEYKLTNPAEGGAEICVCLFGKDRPPRAGRKMTAAQLP